jgi:purine nucleosidase/pyrimidine-specific ribonucleoside hydrolase
VGLWIDTDGGVDDALALVCALAVCGGRLAGVSTVFGNVSPRRAARNAALVQAFFPGPSAPVHVGADRPLTGHPWHDAHAIHGEDGLGGVTADHELAFETGVVQESHPDETADAMAAFARAAGPDGRLVCIGPMTNLARALLRDAAAFDGLGAIVCMGTSLRVPPARRNRGEFNAGSDLEAARIVLERAPRLTLVPLDTCRRVVLRRARLAAIADRLDGPVLKFLRRAHTHYMDAYREMEGIDGCYPHDALAVAAAIAPAGLFALERGGFALGAEGRFDGLLQPDPAARPVTVARDADFRAALDWIEACLERAAELTPLATAPYTGRQKDRTHAS